MYRRKLNGGKREVDVKRYVTIYEKGDPGNWKVILTCIHKIFSPNTFSKNEKTQDLLCDFAIEFIIIFIFFFFVGTSLKRVKEMKIGRNNKRYKSLQYFNVVVVLMVPFNASFTLPNFRTKREKNYECFKKWWHQICTWVKWTAFVLYLFHYWTIFVFAITERKMPTDIDSGPCKMV